MPQWDDLVVGYGPIGAVVARRLAEAGRRVAMVEQGNAVTDPPGSHLRNEPVHNADPDRWFGAIDQYCDYLDADASPAALPGAFTTSIIGGSGILWTNNCPRAVAGIDRPDLLTDDEWDASYSVAEECLGVSEDQFDDSTRQRSILERLGSSMSDQGRRLTRLPLSGDRVGPDRIHYDGPADIVARSTGDIEMLSGQADRVETTGSHATGVRIGDDLLTAENIVLAGGAVDTPHLLWRSGIRPAALGRYLSYHPVLIGQMVLDAELSDPAPEPDPLPRLCIAPTESSRWFTMILRDTNPLTPAAPDLDVPANRLAEIQVFSSVDPVADHHMRFTETTVEFDIALTDADEDRRRQIEADAEEICDRLGRWRAGCRPIWAPLGTPHLMGSCRAGTADDGTSVTDGRGRVWGFENLYLATNGLIPTGLCVNPTLTTAALAANNARQLVAPAG